MDEFIEDMLSKGLISIKQANVLQKLDDSSKTRLCSFFEINLYTREYKEPDMWASWLRHYGRN